MKTKKKKVVTHLDRIRRNSTDYVLKKNEEYATDSDVFRNFRTGISLQDKPQAVAWEYMTKHLQWIKDAINTDHKPTHAELDEKFIDAINYLLIIRAMYQDRS